jgi:hypothetical protein
VLPSRPPMAPAVSTKPVEDGPDSPAAFIAALRAAMRRRSWSQARLADWLGTDTRRMEDWLAGRCPSRALRRAVLRSLEAGTALDTLEYLSRALEALQAGRGDRAHKPALTSTVGDEEAALEEAARAAGVDPAVLRDAWLARQAQVPPAT